MLFFVVAAEQFPSPPFCLCNIHSVLYIYLFFAPLLFRVNLSINFINIILSIYILTVCEKKMRVEK